MVQIDHDRHCIIVEDNLLLALQRLRKCSLQPVLLNAVLAFNLLQQVNEVILKQVRECLFGLLSEQLGIFELTKCREQVQELRDRDRFDQVGFGLEG